MAINVSVQYKCGLLPDVILFKKNLNASKPSEHPPQVEECLKVQVGTLAVETKPLHGIKRVPQCNYTRSTV